jgi:hypothetical protein
MSIDTFQFKGQEVTPRVVVETIVKKYPGGGSERWLRIFESVVTERPDLRRLCVQQAFAATLMSLSASNAPPSR